MSSLSTISIPEYERYKPRERRQLSPEEEKEVEAGKSRWIPRIFQSHGTKPAEMMASPLKQALLHALLGGGIGALGGGAIGNSIGRDAGVQGGAGVGAAIGGLGLGALGGAAGYFGREAENENIEDMMMRNAPGARRRDLASDPMNWRSVGMTAHGNASLEDLDMPRDRSVFRSMLEKEGALRQTLHRKLSSVQPKAPAPQRPLGPYELLLKAASNLRNHRLHKQAGGGIPGIGSLPLAGRMPGLPGAGGSPPPATPDAPRLPPGASSAGARISPAAIAGFGNQRQRARFDEHMANPDKTGLVPDQIMAARQISDQARRGGPVPQVNQDGTHNNYRYRPTWSPEYAQQMAKEKAFADSMAANHAKGSAPAGPATGNMGVSEAMNDALERAAQAR